VEIGHGDHLLVRRLGPRLQPPDYLARAAVAKLTAASRCEPEPLAIDVAAGGLSFTATLLPLAVTAVTIPLAGRAHG